MIIHKREVVECGVSGCSLAATQRGWCSKHYDRWRRHGDPTALKTNRIDLTGRTFGRLTVLRFSSVDPDRHVRWECTCTARVTVRGTSLHTGLTQSCGCLPRDLIIRQSTKHGEYINGESAEHASFQHAKARCRNPHNQDYKYYGERGIKFLFDSFEQFLECLGRKPTPKHSLDRFPDKNGNYEPGNVRWATQSEQCRNTRRNHFLAFNGTSKLIIEWAETVNISWATLYGRVRRRWCAACVITQPLFGQCSHKETT